jgi:hypothetical protein
MADITGKLGAVQGNTGVQGASGHQPAGHHSGDLPDEKDPPGGHRLSRRQLTGGKFSLGVGTGEAVNEHITGAKWPTAAERRDMLAEAVTIIT